MRFDLILFDLDGTLVDTSRDIHESLAHVMNLRGLPPVDVQTTLGWVGDGVVRLIEQATGLRQAEASAEVEEAVSTFKRHYEDNLVVHSQLYPGVRDVVEVLSADRTLAVVTNKPEALSHRLLEALDLSRYFRAILGPERFEHKKPSPEPILYCLDEFKFYIRDETDTNLAVRDEIVALVREVIEAERKKAEPKSNNANRQGAPS